MTEVLGGAIFRERACFVAGHGEVCVCYFCWRLKVRKRAPRMASRVDVDCQVTIGAPRGTKLLPVIRLGASRSAAWMTETSPTAPPAAFPGLIAATTEALFTRRSR